MHAKIHFTAKYVRYTHMLASYMTAVQIFRLLNPHARFVNRKYVILARAAGHAELLALVQKKPSVSVGINSHGLIQLVNSSLEGLTEVFDGYLTGSEYMIG